MIPAIPLWSVPGRHHDAGFGTPQWISDSTRVRWADDARRDSTVPALRGVAGSRYVDQRHYVVIDDLDALDGPASGVVVLDRALDWSPDPTYDLDDAGDRQVMYQTVLNEATSAAQLARWIDRDTLLDIWPRLWLPAGVRSAWETRHAVLRDRAGRLAG
jgi:hypothetical protein